MKVVFHLSLWQKSLSSKGVFTPYEISLTVFEGKTTSSTMLFFFLFFIRMLQISRLWELARRILWNLWFSGERDEFEPSLGLDNKMHPFVIFIMLIGLRKTAWTLFLIVSCYSLNLHGLKSTPLTSIWKVTFFCKYLHPKRHFKGI